MSKARENRSRKHVGNEVFLGNVKLKILSLGAGVVVVGGSVVVVGVGAGVVVVVVF